MRNGRGDDWSCGRLVPQLVATPEPAIANNAAMKLSTTIGVALLALSGAASADCIEEAAANFGTNADVLRAIAIVESKVRPQAVNVNPNGSIDRGLFQINSIHLPELAAAGIGPDDLHDVCLSSNVAALLLKRKIKVFGDTWAAVGAYHSTIPAKSERYIRKVRAVFDGMQRLRITAQAQ